VGNAPKSLWIDPDYLQDETDCVSTVKVLHRDIEYIRADLVDGLVDLLVEWQNVTSANKDWDDYEMRIEFALAALKALEEE